MHAGAVIVPAVLAACERHRPDGAAALRGIAVGVETMCRLGLVTPKLDAQGGLSPDRRVRRAGGGGRRGSGARARPRGIVMRSASPAAWRRASSNISPRARGPSGCTPAGRRNPGSRAALMARAGFVGPRTVLEGTHGFFHGFAHTTKGVTTC